MSDSKVYVSNAQFFRARNVFIANEITLLSCDMMTGKFMARPTSQNSLIENIFWPYSNIYSKRYMCILIFKFLF